MRRYFIYSILAAFSLLSLGCEQLSENNSDIGQSLTVNATYDNGNSKATVVDGGTSVYWEPNDEIKVFCGQESGRLVSTNVENSKTATFTGTVSGKVNPSTRNKLYALYPYREDASFDDGVITTTLPEIQTAVAGSFDRNANIALAASESTDLLFRNVCGGLRFTLTHPGIKRIVFESNGGEYISGEFSVQFKDGVPVVKKVNTGGRKVILETKDGSAFETGVWYYMSFLPCTLTEGYTMTFSTSSEYAVLSVEKEQIITRNTYGAIPEIESGLIWEDEELKENSFDLKDGVLTIGATDVAKYLSAIEAGSFTISEYAPSEIIPGVGDIVFFESGNKIIPYVLGKVTSVIQTKSPGYAVTLEDVAFDDVFNGFHICEDIMLSDVPQTITDEDGNVYEYGIGSADIWDELTVPVSDTTSVDGIDSTAVVRKSVQKGNKASAKSRYPGYVKITNEIIRGNLYLDFIAHPDIRYDAAQNTIIANVPCEVRLGFEGDIGLESSSSKFFNILQKIKIPIGSAGIFQFYFVPDLSLFCEGKASIGGDVKLEFYHGSFVMTNELGKNSQYKSLEKERYFNIAKFKSNGAIGIRYGIGIHSSVFNEKLFGFGIDLSGSLKAQISGEFPSAGGKDLSESLTARIQPTVDLVGYVDWRMALNKPDKLEIPIFSANLTPYEINLLPLFRLVSSKVNSGGKTAVIQAKAFRNSFISSTEGGYCLYYRGDDKPLSYKQMYITSAKSSSKSSEKGYPTARSSEKSGNGGISFELESGKSYEIAPYAIVNEGEYVYGKKTPLDNPLCPDENHVHAIDLGLSVKWACCNVGATRPEEYGGYYAWGETEEKSNYAFETYKYYRGGYFIDGHWCDTGYTKYVTDSSWGFDGFTDGKTVLEPSDDVAHVKWGGSWRMPTLDECQELINNCTREWTTSNGVYGMKFTSKKNGNSIFLPATGCRFFDSFYDAGSSSGYWSSSLDPDYPYDARDIYFYRDYMLMTAYQREGGHSVRPVSE